MGRTGAVLVLAAMAAGALAAGRCLKPVLRAREYGPGALGFLIVPWAAGGLIAGAVFHAPEPYASIVAAVIIPMFIIGLHGRPSTGL